MKKDKKLKILVVAHSSKISGANRSMLDILLRLRDRFEFIVLFPEKKGELQHILKSNNIEVIYYPYRWQYAQDRFNKTKAIYRYIVDFLRYYSRIHISKKFKKEITNRKIDIIYTNTSTVNIGAKLARSIEVPHVWHIREFGKEDFNFKRLLPKNIDKRYKEQSSALIVISDSLKKKYECIAPKANIIRIYNGLNVEKLKYQRLETNSLSNKINILITGQVSNGKNQIDGVRAINYLIKKGYNIELFLVGSYDDAYVDYLVKNIDSKEWLHITGNINDVYEFRKNMDIELICSKSEAFGRVTIEAMLHSIPVIVSNSGGNTELVNNMKSGLIYETGNYKDLADKIQFLINNKDLRDDFVSNAYIDAQKFTIERTVSELEHVFKSVNLKKRSNKI